MSLSIVSELFSSGEIVIYAAYLFIGGAVYVLARMLLQEQETRAAQETIEETRNRDAKNFLVRITRPFFSQYVVPMIRGKPYWDGRRRAARRKIITAGLKEELTADEFIAFKAFLIIFFPIVGGFLVALDLLDAEWWQVLGSGVLGWYYPDIWANQRIKERQKLILKQMPFVVDLLALSTEAGLDFVGAISKVVEKSVPGPLIDEFEQVLKEIRIGSSRSDALREMGSRIDMTAVSSFIAILISADQMGASIGKILRQQTDQIRTERFVRAEKAGAAAAQKVLIPLVLFILPAVLLMIAGPFVLSFIYG